MVWTQKNIAAFGGDPKKVFIVGQVLMKTLIVLCVLCSRKTDGTPFHPLPLELKRGLHTVHTVHALYTNCTHTAHTAHTAHNAHNAHTALLVVF